MIDELKRVAAVLSPENVERAKDQATAVGDEVRFRAERMDSKLAEMSETLKAAQIKATTKTLTVAGDGGASNGMFVTDRVSPSQGTYWAITHISYRWTCLINYWAPAVLINGTSLDPFSGRLLDIPDFDRVYDGTNITMPSDYPYVNNTTTWAKAIHLPAPYIVTDKDYIYGINPAANARGSIKIDFQIEEYTTEPVFDTVG